MLEHMFFVITLSLLFAICVDGHCVDIHSQIVSQGLHYVPGPNPCTLCICDRGNAKWCKSVLCSPPQNCKSFQVGNSCCEFKCLDDILTANDGYKETYDLALRLAASAITAVLSLSLLFFLLHRLKRRKIQIRQNRQMNEDQRSLNSIGYIAGSLGYLSGNISYLSSGTNEIEFHYEEASPHYSLWKPPGNYFPRDEAPPPYEEAVRSAQTEHSVVPTITNSSLPSINTASQRSNHPNSLQQNTSNVSDCRHEYTVNSFCNNHEYANIATPHTVLYQSGINRESTVNNTSCGEVSKRNGTDVANNKTSRNGQSVSYENVVVQTNNDYVDVPRNDELKWPKEYRHKYERMHVKNQPRDNTIKKSTDKLKSYQTCKLPCKDKKYFYENGKHRTIPNLLELQFKEMNTLKENVQKLNKIELRKSCFGERSENNIHSLASGTFHCSLPKSMRDLTSPNTSLQTFEIDAFIHKSLPKQTSLSLVKSHPTGENSGKDVACKFSEGVNPSSTSHNSDVSYQYLSYQDEEDYRSECENCKSSDFTNIDDEEGDVLNETMTLQRRPLEQGEELPYYRTSLTLPTNTKRPRTVLTNPVRESWFVAMQETSSSEESE